MKSIPQLWKQMTTFFAEVKAEMAKVTFPSRDEVIGTTIVVVVTSVIFAFFLWVADIVIMTAYEGIIRVLS